MRRNTIQNRRSSTDAARSRWITVAYHDEAGIDGDIERLLDSVQRANGCSRDTASAELLRRLSFAA